MVVCRCFHRGGFRLRLVGELEVWAIANPQRLQFIYEGFDKSRIVGELKLFEPLDVT